MLKHMAHIPDDSPGHDSDIEVQIHTLWDKTERGEEPTRVAVLGPGITVPTTVDDEEPPEFVPTASTEMVELAPGLTVPRMATSFVSLSDDSYVQADLRLHDGRYQAYRITVVNDCRKELTSDDLRKITLRDIYENAVLPNVTNSVVVSLTADGRGVENFAWGLFGPDDAEEMRSEGPTRRTLSAVANLYRVAHALRVSTRKTIMRTFGIAGPTADVWVSKARAEGLLDPVTKPEDTE